MSKPTKIELPLEVLNEDTDGYEEWLLKANVYLVPTSSRWLAEDRGDDEVDFSDLVFGPNGKKMKFDDFLYEFRLNEHDLFLKAIDEAYQWLDDLDSDYAYDEWKDREFDLENCE